MIQLLLQNRNINPNLFLSKDYDKTLLSEAIVKNDIKQIKFLLSCPNTDINIVHNKEGFGGYY